MRRLPKDEAAVSSGRNTAACEGMLLGGAPRRTGKYNFVSILTCLWLLVICWKLHFKKNDVKVFKHLCPVERTQGIFQFCSVFFFLRN